MKKKELRDIYRSVRKNITQRNEKDDKIYSLFIKSDFFISCDSLFLYSAYGSEVQTLKIAEYAFSRKKRVAFPLCKDREGNMDFYFVTGADDLKKGMYGISEPDFELCSMAFPDEKTLIAVPALSFDRRGFRLGYGKGYYDRYLSGFPGVSVGLVYEECICDALPKDIYDKNVDYLISDKKIYKFDSVKEE